MNILQGIVAEGIGHRNVQVPAPHLDRDDLVLLGQPLGDDLDPGGLDRRCLQVDARHPELGGESSGDVVLGADAPFNDQFTNPLVAVLLLYENLLEVFRGHDPRFDEEFTNSLLLPRKGHRKLLLCVRLQAAEEISHTIHRTFPRISKGEYGLLGEQEMHPRAGG